MIRSIFKEDEQQKKKILSKKRMKEIVRREEEFDWYPFLIISIFVPLAVFLIYYILTTRPFSEVESMLMKRKEEERYSEICKND